MNSAPQLVTEREEVAVSADPISLYLATDYREALKARLAELKEQYGKAYNVSALAEHCRTHVTYLYPVLALKTHINEDQLYMAMSFLQFSADEQEYLNTLHALQRTTFAERRETLSDKLHQLRNRHMDGMRNMSREVVYNEEQRCVALYLDPQCLIIHTFLSIPKFQRDPKLIAGHLSVSEALVQEKIDKLLKFGLLEKSGHRFKYINPPLLSRDSHYSASTVSLLKMYASKKVESLPQYQKNNGAFVFSCTAEAGLRIRAAILNVFKEIDRLAWQETADPTDVYQFSFDFFAWTEKN